MKANHQAPAPSMLRLLAGFGVWALAFVVLYVGHALACLYVRPDTSGAEMARAVLALLWLGHVLLLAYMAWRSRVALSQLAAQAGDGGGNRRFMCRVTLMLDVFACLATIATGLPLAWVKVCGA